MLSDTSTAVQDYARKARAMIQLVAKLRALGAEADLPLPKIAVIGNQSAGKSSLVEAIADITVPRDVSTCTRCPMECRLSYSPDPWQCQVLLRFEKDDDGSRLQKTKEIRFGSPLKAKNQLETMLRRAQLAILNPTLPPERFVDYDLTLVNPDHIPDGSTRQLQFSGNVVVLDLQGPDVPDLSFIDLPGIIANVGEGDDPMNIELIKNLVKEHIGGNALILTVITMRDDIDNQSAVTLAKEADPDGLRTIGVLTKPDTVQPGEEDTWFNVLHGKRYKLLHGYFVTKQPGPQELKVGMKRTTARLKEKEFFKTTVPWKDAASNIKTRLGVENLSKELSRLLSQLIEETLPTLRAQSRSSLQTTVQVLSDLPQPPSKNATAEIIGLVTDFCGTVHRMTEATDGNERVIQSCRQMYTNFKFGIKSTTPEFSAENTMDDTEALKPRSLGAVHKLIQRSLTRQLPMNVPGSVKSKLMQQCFEEWPALSRACFLEVHGIVYTTLEMLVKQQFGRYGALKEEVSIIMDNLIDRIKISVEERVAWALKLNDPAFTLNDHYFNSYREKYMDKYRRERQYPSQVPTASGEPGPIPQIPDQYEEEIIVMAEVRAYFQIAYKRVIDLIPLIIDHDFIRHIDNNMQHVLLDKLGIGSEDAAVRHASYVRENPGIVQQREELIVKKARLEEIIVKLTNFALGS